MESDQHEKLFKKIYIEISNICNLQCTFCPVVERDKKVMNLEQLSKIFDQSAPLAERVCLHVMGEPLNHPQFSECLDLATQKNIAIEITTNGTLLNEKSMESLLKTCVVQINFSLQSFVDNFPQANPQMYFDKIVSFSKRALKERPELYLNYRFWNLTEDLKSEEINEYFLSTIEKEFSATINRRVDPAFKKSKNVIGRLYVHFDSRFEWPSLKSSVLSQRGTCHGGRSQLAIHADGVVVPCCLDKEADIPLGSIIDQSLSEILTSKRYQNLKQGFINNQLVEDLCQRCSFRQRFDGKLF